MSRNASWYFLFKYTLTLNTPTPTPTHTLTLRPFLWKIPKNAKYLAIFIVKSWFLWKISIIFGIIMLKYTEHYFSSWNIFDENFTLYSPLAFYIGNTLRWQTEFLVYFRMLIPNIVLIFHKNKLLTIKIIKYFVFFGIFHTNGPSVSPRSRSKRTLRTKTKYEFSHNSTSSKKLAYSEIAG
jgi:hypothetical protein